eukprot:g29311.t1
MQLYQDSKGSNFDEDKDVIVYDVDFDLQVPSVQLKELASLEELRAELQRTPMATPPFAKVEDGRGRPQICMLGPHTYKKQEQQVSVFPVLDPSQERVVPLAKCAIYRKGSLAWRAVGGPSFRNDRREAPEQRRRARPFADDLQHTT